MMPARLRLAAKMPAPALERDRLSGAIAARDEHRAAMAATDAAHAAITAQVYALRSRQEEAARAVDAAPVAFAEHAVAVASGFAEPPPMTVRKARAFLEDIGDELAAADLAREALAARSAELNGQAASREMFVKDAAAAVIVASGAAAKLIAEVARLEAELAKQGCALAFLASQDAIPRSFPPRSQFTAAETAVHRLQSPPATWRELFDADCGGWPAAMARLQADPMAALPGE